MSICMARPCKHAFVDRGMNNQRIFELFVPSTPSPHAVPTKTAFSPLKYTQYRLNGKKSSKPRCLWDDSGVGAFANFVVWCMDCCWCWAIKIRPDGTDMSIFVVLFQWCSVWDNPNRTNINALVVVTKVTLCLKWLNWCAYAGHFSRLSLLCGVSHLN